MAWVVERKGARGVRYRGGYRDPDGRLRSAGTFSTRRDALRAANREEQKVLAGAWHDTTLGEVTFTDYVQGEWLPNKHVEASTRAAYISYLNKHFYPFFGHRRLNRISPSLVQDWATQAAANGLSPRSIRKYHVLLSSIFARAVNDRILVHNPCDHTELPKVNRPGFSGGCVVPSEGSQRAACVSSRSLRARLADGARWPRGAGGC